MSAHAEALVQVAQYARALPRINMSLQVLFLHHTRRLAMRFRTKVMVTLVVVPAVLQASGNSGLGASNCGFLTLEQCRASVSGIGGFCVPNQFYNPQRAATGPRKQREVRASRQMMPYDPYPWCAAYSDSGGL